MGSGPLERSGGEPFQQPEALEALLRALHAWRGARAIDLLVYSGLTAPRLQIAAAERRMSPHGEAHPLLHI